MKTILVLSLAFTSAFAARPDASRTAVPVCEPNLYPLVARPLARHLDAVGPENADLASKIAHAMLESAIRTSSREFLVRIGDYSIGGGLRVDGPRLYVRIVRLNDFLKLLRFEPLVRPRGPGLRSPMLGVMRGILEGSLLIADRLDVDHVTIQGRAVTNADLGKFLENRAGFRLDDRGIAGFNHVEFRRAPSSDASPVRRAEYSLRKWWRNRTAAPAGVGP